VLGARTREIGIHHGTRDNRRATSKRKAVLTSRSHYVGRGRGRGGKGGDGEGEK
jgi:hypothetical protein